MNTEFPVGELIREEQLEQQGPNEGLSGIRTMSRGELSSAVTKDPS